MSHQRGAAGCVICLLQVQAREEAAAGRERQLQDLEASLTAREQLLQARTTEAEGRERNATESSTAAAAAAGKVAEREAQVSCQ